MTKMTKIIGVNIKKLLLLLQTSIIIILTDLINMTDIFVIFVIFY